MLAAAALAGCGGSHPRTTFTVTKVPPPARDGFEKIVARCELSQQRSATPDVVPTEFKPRRTRVVAAQRTAQGFTASLYYDRPVGAAYKALRRMLVAAGYTISRSENEGRDAELFLDRGGQPSEVRLSVAGACPHVTRATVATG